MGQHLPKPPIHVVVEEKLREYRNIKLQFVEEAIEEFNSMGQQSFISREEFDICLGPILNDIGTISKLKRKMVNFLQLFFRRSF